MKMKSRILVAIVAIMSMVVGSTNAQEMGIDEDGYSWYDTSFRIYLLFEKLEKPTKDEEQYKVTISLEAGKIKVGETIDFYTLESDSTELSFFWDYEENTSENQVAVHLDQEGFGVFTDQRLSYIEVHNQKFWFSEDQATNVQMNAKKIML